MGGKEYRIFAYGRKNNNTHKLKHGEPNNYSPTLYHSQIPSGIKGLDC